MHVWNCMHLKWTVPHFAGCKTKDFHISPQLDQISSTYKAKKRGQDSHITSSALQSLTFEDQRCITWQQCSLLWSKQTLVCMFTLSSGYIQINWRCYPDGDIWMLLSIWFNHDPTSHSWLFYYTRSFSYQIIRAYEGSICSMLVLHHIQATCCDYMILYSRTSEAAELTVSNLAWKDAHPSTCGVHRGLNNLLYYCHDSK